MKEFSTPLLVEPSGHRNATELLLQRYRTSPDHVAFEVRAAGAAVTEPWRQVTTRQFVDEVRALAKGLLAAGIEPGESLAIMSPTRYEWALADMAAWFAGAVVVPVYETSAAPQVTAILADAGVRLAIAGTAGHAALLEVGFAEAGIPGLGIWTMDVRPGADLADLVARGAGISDAAVEERRLLAGLDSVATIVYTSGTTAAPKGALITHGNFVGQVLNVAAAYTGVVREGGNTIIFLPMAHVLARGLQLTCLANGMRIAHLSDPRDVVPALGVLKPTFLVVVPRVLQKIQASAAAAAAQKHLGPVWASAQGTAVAWGRFAQARDADPATRPGLGLRVRHALFDRLFYARLRTLMGGRLDYLLSGAAALDAELSLFFRGLGLPVVEGYGLTETTAPLTGNMPGSIRAGSVGVPMPGTTVRISDRGEVLARGVGVFAGYRRRADNADAFTDGFFHTGDLGELDESGSLTLNGRIKDVIVTAGGKTISPAIWEGYVEGDPLVAHAVMVGEGKPYLGGLVLLDPESVAAWAEREGIADLTGLQIPDDGGAVQIDDVRLLSAIGKAVSAANAKIARSEQVRRFVLLLTDLSEANGIVTPTMKLKRGAFTERAHHIVDKLYADPRSQA
ncbi:MULTISPECIES: AMP-dependent synthetase/ligase [unclassified Arthrobacter]|uniref:AMP-dependent synthetase/ligase n=1 Tax=unclassified Arthrobacter TaxID=235627 RepID=UPI002DF9B557|nr:MULTISPECIES: AMP-dependent synthetase/ligase [unclassified Arthrobacter]MEC5191789.1 long-chain acyl-CoA synthetase [Arthrobacter sp. MP_M4]MEC5203479.1 long-chain acyl-CoA synthetase [Arthrobacter sp. MP_M7]